MRGLVERDKTVVVLCGCLLEISADSGAGTFIPPRLQRGSVRLRICLSGPRWRSLSASRARLHTYHLPPLNLCAFASLREILSSGIHTREAVGGPGLGADTVVDEEKTSGIVFFFDRF